MAEGGGFKEGIRRIGSSAKDRILRVVKRGKEQPIKTATIQSSQPTPLPDIQGQEKFKLWDYHYLRQAFYQLQIGHKGPETNFEQVALPNMTAELSSRVGQMGTVLGQDMLVQLREGRVDEHGKPRVLCVDEVSDSRVLQGATGEDRVKFFRQAFQRVIKPLPFTGFWLGDEKSYEGFSLTTVAMGSMILDQLPENVRRLVTNFTQTTEGVNSDVQSNMIRTLQNLDPVKFKALSEYLIESKQRIIQEQRLNLQANGPREVKEFGEGPLEVDGQTFRVEGAGQTLAEVDQKEMRSLLPFYKAIHTSRQSMVNTAKAFAGAYLGATPDEVARYHPPLWFTQADNGEGLRSDEILILIPTENPDRYTRFPDFVQQLKDSGVNKSGWYKLKIPQGDNKITRVSRLTN